MGLNFSASATISEDILQGDPTGPAFTIGAKITFEVTGIAYGKTDMLFEQLDETVQRFKHAIMHRLEPDLYPPQAHIDEAISKAQEEQSVSHVKEASYEDNPTPVSNDIERTV